MSRTKNLILVVDDEPGQRQLLSAALEDSYSVVTAANGREARHLLEHHSVDLIITDDRMPGIGGLELIKWVVEHSPETPVLMLTAYGSIETAVEAMKLGAKDYLTKPLKSPEELRLTVARALGERTLKNERLVHAAEMEEQFPQDIIAESTTMRRVIELAAQVAPQSATVLLTGESGTGKEIVARFIHRQSPRGDGPFVAVNCAALTETLLESELFGHERGSFTGATQAKRGRFELAHGGTLFLDEIGEMSVNLQTKLLRALETQQFERVGGTRTITVDERVIAATNKNLERAIAEKAFRDDLYYRLNVFPIHIPPLRERREDILPLAEYMVKKISARIGQPAKALTAEVRQILYRYDFPGNVRELQNAIERALIVTRSVSISREDLPLKLSIGAGAIDRASSLADIEQAAILEALAQHEGDRAKTARQLGISLRTLQYRLKDYGLAGRD